MFYQKITNSLILCIFCSILSISFCFIRFYNIFRRNARDLGNLRNENSSLKCAADWSRPHKASKMGESTMTEKRYLKWYNKVGYGSGDIAGNVVYAFLSSFVMIYLTNTVGLNPGILWFLSLWMPSSLSFSLVWKWKKQTNSCVQQSDKKPLSFLLHLLFPGGIQRFLRGGWRKIIKL